MSTITIKDIAKKCGVGISTVSRAMNNHPDVSEETKEMIMRVIKESNYIPNNSAQNLKRSQNKTIAVLVKGFTNPIFHRMIDVFEKELNEKGYSFLLHRVEQDKDEVEVALQLIKEKRLKGIIFLGGFFSHTEEKLAQLSVPFVLSTVGVSGEMKKSIYSFVSVDDVKESTKLIEYLCELGHKNIAILAASEEDESIGKLRLLGYKEALEKNKIPITDQLICYSRPDEDPYTMASGYERVKKLLDDKTEFTAVFAISDQTAIGACRALVEAEKKIPEDCSVVGFDGLDVTYYYNPSITTISQPVEEMAKESIQILFDLMKKQGNHQHKLFEGHLLARESTKSVLSYEQKG